MARPASVTVVAVLSILGGLFTLLMGAVFGLLTLMPPPAGVQQTEFERYAMLFTGGLFAALSIWGIVTAIGLFRMKRWARVSTLVFSAGLICFAILGLIFLGFFFLGLIPLTTPPGASDPILRGAMMGVGAFYGLLLAISIWWLLLFNRAAIKAQFYGGTVPVEPFPIPLSIQVIAWLLLTTCIFFPFLVFTDWPATFLAWIVTGWAATLLYLVYGVAGVAAGYGLLRRRMWAYWLTVGYLGFALVSMVIFYGLPGAQTRIDELNRMLIPAGANVDVPQVTPLFGILMGFLGMGPPLYFLLTRKKRYEEACRATMTTGPSSAGGIAAN